MEKIKWSASHIITATVKYFTVTFYCKLNIWIDIQITCAILLIVIFIILLNVEQTQAWTVSLWGLLLHVY